MARGCLIVHAAELAIIYSKQISICEQVAFDVHVHVDVVGFDTFRMRTNSACGRIGSDCHFLLRSSHVLAHPLDDPVLRRLGQAIVIPRFIEHELV
jgi:hypothetical protein